MPQSLKTRKMHMVLCIISGILAAAGIALAVAGSMNSDAALLDHSEGDMSAIQGRLQQEASETMMYAGISVACAFGILMFVFLGLMLRPTIITEFLGKEPKVAQPVTGAVAQPAAAPAPAQQVAPPSPDPKQIAAGYVSPPVSEYWKL
ncbi:hypothetical protein OAM67_01685 [bacterium]|nr:hypothetical protein [bacterium]